MPNTTNLNLKLWQGSDMPNYATPNENYNKIDNAFGTISAQVTENTSDLETFDSKIDNVNSQIDELKKTDTELSTKIAHNEEQTNYCISEIQTDKADISVLKNRVKNIEDKQKTPDIDYSELNVNGNITHSNLSRAVYESTVKFTGITNDNENVQVIRSPLGNGYYIRALYSNVRISLTDLFNITDITNVKTSNINIFSSQDMNVSVTNVNIIKDSSLNKVYLSFDLMSSGFSLDPNGGFNSTDIFNIFIKVTKG